MNIPSRIRILKKALLFLGFLLISGIAASQSYHMVFPIEGIPYKTAENDILLFSNKYCGTNYSTLTDLQDGGLPCLNITPTEAPPIEVSTINAYINLEGTQFSDLSFLSTLTTLGGSYTTINVRGMNSLTDFTGLENLSGVVGKLRADYVMNITSFNGLGNVTEFNWQLYITRNPYIYNLSGFDSLQKIDTLFVQNSNFLDFTGAPNLNYIREIHGYGSDFTSLAGLEGLTYIDGTYDFNNSAALTNVDALINVTGTSDSGTGESGILLHNSPVLDDVSGLQNIAAGQISLDLRDYTTKAPATSPLCQNFNTGDDITGVVVQGWDGAAFSLMPKSYVCAA